MHKMKLIPVDPTYIAAHDLELLLEQNMLAAAHQSHSTPENFRSYHLNYFVPMRWTNGKEAPEMNLYGRPIRIGIRSWLILQINAIGEI
jgi:hypothetical protein